MLKKIYMLFSAVFFTVYLAGNLYASIPSTRANDIHNLVPSAGRKVFVALASPSAKAPILVTNYGNTIVNDFDYTLSFEGKVIREEKYILSQPLKRMEGATAEIMIPPHDRRSQTELVFTITKVNGTPNGTAINYTTIPRFTVTKVPHRKIVVEDYTGMWCGYCPRGIALMENLANTYANDFIGIAIHTGGRIDPLTCQDYWGKASEYRSRPSLVMNRNLLLGYFKATTEFEEEKARGAEMDIEVSAVWDAQKEDITVTPRVTFCIDKNDASYGFAYVLTEDSMSNSGWSQANYYSGRTEDKGITKELDYFINAGYTIKGLVNNCVAIAAEGVHYPLRGYLTLPIEADKTQSHQYAFRNISKYKVIQKKSNLSVCVLLINIATGHIENAAKCSIADAGTTNISNVAVNDQEGVVVARYTLDGQLITAPVRGINLVKYSNGRIVKEVVR